MKRKSLFKNIILMSLVIIAALIAVMMLFLIAEKALKEFIAFVLCAAFIVVFGVANAG